MIAVRAKRPSGVARATPIAFAAAPVPGTAVVVYGRRSTLLEALRAFLRVLVASPVLKAVGLALVLVWPAFVTFGLPDEVGKSQEAWGLDTLFLTASPIIR